MSGRPPRGRDEWPARRRTPQRRPPPTPFVVEGPQLALFDAVADLLPDAAAGATAETTSGGTTNAATTSDVGTADTRSPETTSTRTESR